MDFLDSENFEKMAKEYNLKYQNVAALGISSLDKDVMKEVFSNIHTLFHFFNKHINSNTFDELANQLYEKMASLNKELDLQSPVPTGEIKSNKQALDIALKVIFMLLEQENPSNFDQIHLINELFVKATMHYFSGFYEF